MASRSKISPTKRRRIMDRCESRCVRCGTTGDLQIDHIVPLSRGGTNDDANLQVLCGMCNIRKLDFLPDEAPEQVVLHWATEVFGPTTCNERLNLRLIRRLLRYLAINAEFSRVP